jgi:hypothetical protein
MFYICIINNKISNLFNYTVGTGQAVTVFTSLITQRGRSINIFTRINFTAIRWEKYLQFLVF